LIYLFLMLLTIPPCGDKIAPGSYHPFSVKEKQTQTTNDCKTTVLHFSSFFFLEFSS